VSKTLSIAICGCGPAGLSAALFLHRAGHRVCVFDQFERPGPVGSGLILQPTGLAALEALGLREQVLRLGARIERLFGRAVPSQRVVLDVRYEAMGARWHGVAIHRAALFDVLHRTAQAEHIPIVPATRLTRVAIERGQAMLFARQDRHLGAFDLVVDALGANSVLAPATRRSALPFGALWATVPWVGGVFRENALEQRYRRANEMAGVLPVGRQTVDGPPQATFFWSLKHADEARWRSESIEAWKAQVHALWPETEPFLAAIERHESLTFARYDHFTVSRPWSERVVHIGDCAHATSPQLGQGANMALLDTLALTWALEENDELTQALPRYARMRFWHVRLFQAASALFTPFYQSDSRLLAFVRDRITAPISTLPGANALLARLVSGMTVPPLGRRCRERLASLLLAARDGLAQPESLTETTDGA